MSEPVVRPGDEPLHVVPVFEGEPKHDCAATCWCGPRRELIEGLDGLYGQLFIHERPV